MNRNEPVILGTRGSKLALVQADACAERLRTAGLQVEVRIIKTTSEHHPNLPLAVIDQRDVFTRQLDEALLRGEIDLAVHSAKDVPTEVPEGIVLAAITDRHDPSDVLVSDAGYVVDGLPEGAVVATSSLRRRAQLLHRRPDLRIVEIRGNVDTRVRKMREGQADALVLARAGLDRLGLDGEIGRRFEPDEIVPEAGQGAVALQVREGEEALVSRVDDAQTRVRVEAERTCVARIGAGCLAPVAAYHDGETLVALIAAEDGGWIERRAGTDPTIVADELLAAVPSGR